MPPVISTGYFSIFLVTTSSSDQMFCQMKFHGDFSAYSSSAPYTIGVKIVVPYSLFVAYWAERNWDFNVARPVQPLANEVSNWASSSTVSGSNG